MLIAIDLFQLNNLKVITHIISYMYVLTVCKCKQLLYSRLMLVNNLM